MITWENGKPRGYGVLLAYDRNLALEWYKIFPQPPYHRQDGATGDVLMRSSSHVLAPPVVGPDGTIYVASRNCFLYAFRPDGNLAWKQPQPMPAGGRLVLSHDRLYVLSQDQSPTWWLLPGSGFALIQSYDVGQPPLGDLAVFRGISGPAGAAAPRPLPGGTRPPPAGLDGGVDGGPDGGP